MKYLERALCSVERLELRCSLLPTDGPYAESKEYCLNTRSDDAPDTHPPVADDESRV